MNLLRAITTIGGFTMISRILGFVRDILIAATLGAGLVADAFFIAFKFPNLFRRLFAEGAFNLAFVPLYAGSLETDGEAAAQRFAEEALSVLLWALLIFVTVIQIAMPVVMLGLAPGFIPNPEKFDLAVLLTRLTFPYLLFVSLVSLMAGMLNSLGKFWAAAATPILLNICLIGALLGLAPLLPTPGHALAWGVSGAGMVQFVWMLAHCRAAGISLRLRLPRLSPEVRELLKRMLPVAIGAGIYQVNLVVDMIIASLLPEGSISFLFFADRVNQFPLGIVGVAVGTALLPLLSRQLSAGDEAAAMHSQNRALEFTLLLTLPAAVALAVIAEPVIIVLFQRGEFGSVQSGATAAALAVYALGLPAYVLVKALAPGYFARGDMATPIKIGAAAMVVNVVLNLILMGPFLHVGIAMATVISSWLNAGLLGWFLWRRGHLKPDRRLLSRLPRQILASLGMGAVLWVMIFVLVSLFISPELERITGLVMLVASGLLSYGLFSLLLGTARPSDVKALMKGKDTSLSES